MVPQVVRSVPVMALLVVLSAAVVPVVRGGVAAPVGTAGRCAARQLVATPAAVGGRPGWSAAGDAAGLVVAAGRRPGGAAA